MFLQEWGGDGSRSRAPGPRDQGRGSQEGLFTLRSWGVRPLQDKRRLPSQKGASSWCGTVRGFSLDHDDKLRFQSQPLHGESRRAVPTCSQSSRPPRTLVFQPCLQNCNGSWQREPGSLTLSGAPARTLCEERSPREAEPGNAQPAPQEKNHLQGH